MSSSSSLVENTSRTRSPEQIIQEAFSQERVKLVCGQHGYSGVGYPTQGCKECAQVQLMLLFCNYKGDKQEFLDMLEETLQEACLLDSIGGFDYTPTPTEIHIDKDAA